MKKFDLKKAISDGCNTKSGIPVRIICCDRLNPRYPIVALLTFFEGSEDIVSYTNEGKHDINCANDNLDLVNL